jgi:hypothetical protein
MKEHKTVWLKSGKECFILAQYQDKFWLVAKDGSWGPGTIHELDVVFQFAVSVENKAWKLSELDASYSTQAPQFLHPDRTYAYYES